jgi:hypothetical protein
VTETPHDALAKFVFRDPERAARELSVALPQPLSKRIDWSTLKLHDGSFIDPDLVETHSDLLFQVDVASYPVLVYVLFEHKSFPERLTGFQLLCYVVRVLESHVRQCRAKKLPVLPLPPVIPVVLHHSETGWTAPTELLPLFGQVLEVVPELVACLPNLRFIVDDISHVPDHELRQRAVDAVTKLALWALRDGRVPARLRESFGHWADDLSELEDAEDGGGGTGRDTSVYFVGLERFGCTRATRAGAPNGAANRVKDHDNRRTDATGRSSGRATRRRSQHPSATA